MAKDNETYTSYEEYPFYEKEDALEESLPSEETSEETATSELTEEQISAQTESVFSAYLRKYNQRKKDGKNEAKESQNQHNKTETTDQPTEVKNVQENVNIAYKKPNISPAEKQEFIDKTTQAPDTRAPIVIVGMGAIGCFLAAHFCNAGKRVICFADSVTLKRIDTEGIYIRTPSLVEKNYRPETALIIKQKPELVFVTSKSNQVDVAVSALSPQAIQGSIIISVSSGYSSLSALRKKYGTSVASGTLRYGLFSQNEHNACEMYSSDITLEVANNRYTEREKLVNVVNMLNETGLHTEIKESEAEVIWKQNASFGAISLVCAANMMNIGEVLSSDIARGELQNVISEISNVARSQGYNPSIKDIVEYIKEMPKSYTPPLKRDIEMGKFGELKTFSADIIKTGERYDVSCKTIAQATKKVHARLDSFFD